MSCHPFPFPIPLSHGAAGTNLFDIAIQPGTGNPWIANTDARNLVRFEPALRGHVADHRLTRLDAGSGAATAFDLNPGINYALLPNPAAQSTALAQPTALAFTADGSEVWVAAFGSDRVARVNAATGAVVASVDLRGSGQASRRMRGPRALALAENPQRLYVLNKIANTVSVIGTAGGTVLAEVPVGSHDPTLTVHREGRGFLFDARLSGNGTISCATCHIDGDEPMPVLTANLAGSDVHLQWPAQPPGWVLESTPDLNGQWQTITHPRSAAGNSLQLDDPAGTAEMRFYRMRRAW